MKRTALRQSPYRAVILACAFHDVTHTRDVIHVVGVTKMAAHVWVMSLNKCKQTNRSSRFYQQRSLRSGWK